MTWQQMALDLIQNLHHSPHAIQDGLAQGWHAIRHSGVAESLTKTIPDAWGTKLATWLDKGAHPEFYDKAIHHGFYGARDHKRAVAESAKQLSDMIKVGGFAALWAPVGHVLDWAAKKGLKTATARATDNIADKAAGKVASQLDLISKDIIHAAQNMTLKTDPTLGHYLQNWGSMFKNPVNPSAPIGTSSPI